MRILLILMLSCSASFSFAGEVISFSDSSQSVERVLEKGSKTLVDGNKVLTIKTELATGLHQECVRKGYRGVDIIKTDVTTDSGEYYEIYRMHLYSEAFCY